MGESEMRRQRESWPSDPRTPNLRWDKDRHGNVRCYYRNPDLPGSPQPRLRSPFGTDAFIAEYEMADQSVINGTATKVVRVEKRRLGAAPAAVVRDDDSRTLDYLLAHYYKSPEWTDELGESTQKARRRHLDRMCERVIEDRERGKVRIGSWPWAAIDEEWAEDLRNDYKATPGIGREIIKGLRKAFAVAAAEEVSRPHQSVHWIEAAARSRQRLRVDGRGY
jgi:hypothetical protein